MSLLVGLAPVAAIGLACAAVWAADRAVDRAIDRAYDQPSEDSDLDPRDGRRLVMPIRPENRDRYPADWAAISKRIREARAEGRCECRGECRTGHTSRCRARNGKPHPITGSTVVLTVAHLDHTPENCDDANLKAMCNRCHLAYDAAHHTATARRTRQAAMTAGMEPLFETETETETDA